MYHKVPGIFEIFFILAHIYANETICYSKIKIVCSLLYLHGFMHVKDEIILLKKKGTSCLNNCHEDEGAETSPNI